ncbi:hypothetical protein A2U01_0089003, partial [Trifolium medium]|nr:hypothetical protein [Trifolium medium]
EPNKLRPLRTDPNEPKTAATKSSEMDPEAQTGPEEQPPQQQPSDQASLLKATLQNHRTEPDASDDSG